jgi:uncharacterized membrane protein
VRRLLAILLIPLVIATVAGAILLYPFGKHVPSGPELGLTDVPVHGTAAEVRTADCSALTDVQVGTPPPSDGKVCAQVSVRLTDGPANGKTVVLLVPVEPGTPLFTAHDDLVLAYNGENPADSSAYRIVDFQRGMPLLALGALFALAILLLGRRQGLAALGALGLSLLVIVFFVLPAILAGQSPVAVAVAAAGLIMFGVLYLTHGVSARTSTAVLGTLVSLALIAVLGAIFAGVSRLTGLDEETTNLIAVLHHVIDARGLLLAGVIIGALGVLDDVTVTQTSAVWELQRANPALTWRELYAAGMRVGRDHVSAAVNTLVMAYAGAALPTILAYSLSATSFGAILTTQAIAQEIVRALVGSIGLVAAVPVTTLLAALVASRGQSSVATKRVTASGSSR